MATRRKGAARVAESLPTDNRPPRLLLDTPVWLWWQTDDRRLGTRARRLIADSEDAEVSAASVWEMSIKAGMGKLKLPPKMSMTHEITSSGFNLLAISAEHAESVRHLPPLHRDPFDRLLVAQALLERLTILTADASIAAYPVPVIDAAQ